jgi:beta-glucosidase
MQSGAAVEEWTRYESDFKYLSEMNLNAYRFSIEWSRVEPQEGLFDQEVLAHYGKMLSALRERGVKPLVTLHHFTLPKWVAAQGGWASGRTPEQFAWYCEKVVEKLGPDVMWLTLNEPSIVSALGYLKGSFPPGHTNVAEFMMARRNQVRGHSLAYRRIHELYERKGWGNVEVSFANQQEWVEPRNADNPLDRLLTALMKRVLNSYFVERTRRTTDFLAVNYYFPNRVYLRLGGRFGFIGMAPIEGARTSDTGWTVAPQGLKKVCLDLIAEGKPIYVTENGLADAEDKTRAWMIEGAARALGEAIEGGADVRGYFYWAFTDTFEWEYGYGPLFGLVEVDFKSQARKLRPSAKVYAEIVEANGLPAEEEQ